MAFGVGSSALAVKMMSVPPFKDPEVSKSRNPSGPCPLNVNGTPDADAGETSTVNSTWMFFALSWLIGALLAPGFEARQWGFGNTLPELLQLSRLSFSTPCSLLKLILFNPTLGVVIAGVGVGVGGTGVGPGNGLGGAVPASRSRTTLRCQS